MTAPALLDHRGEPIPRNQAVSQRARILAAGFKNASWSDPDLSAWTPNLYSAHAAYAPDRIALASRIKDLVRNEGWLAAGVSKLTDAVIGSNWMLFSTPNWQSLGIEPDAAADLAVQIETEWSDYAEDPDCWIDAGRQMTFGGILALCFRHRIFDGEALAALLYEPNRACGTATCVHVVDPDRLSNPYNEIDTVTRRMGVELGANDRPLGYWIRAAHPGDAGVYNPNLWKWDYWPRETPWGRRQVLHAFETERAGQVRGQSVINSLIKVIKQMGRYIDAEQQASLMNAIMAAFVESPYDHEKLAEDMSAGDMSELSAYDDSRMGWHEKLPLALGGAQVNFLHSGEKVTLTKPNHPNAVFEHYLRTALRNIASVLGLTYEQFSGDFSQTNYSSFRGALLEAWRGFTARRGFFTNQVPQQIFACFLEEKIDKGIIKLPPGAPDFHAKKAAYCSAEWIGPAKGWVDPVKEGEGAVLRINSGLSSYRREMAEQGIDYRKDFLQQARERKEREALGLPDALSQIAGQVKGNAGNVPESDPEAKPDGKKSNKKDAA